MKTIPLPQLLARALPFAGFRATWLFAIVLGLAPSAEAMKTEVVHAFRRKVIDHVAGPLVEAANGTLYGCSTAGGANDVGFLFRLQTNGVMENILSFDDQLGVVSGSLTRVRSGRIFGISRKGVVQLTDDERILPVAEFTAATGSGLAGNLVEGQDGALYGLTTSGGLYECGTFFRLSAAGEWTVFAPLDCDEYGRKLFGLAAADDGAFYATSAKGGAYGLGTVLRLTPDGTVTPFISFDGTNGVGPTGGVVWGPDGRLYGTTSGIDFDDDRDRNRGTIFGVTLDGVLSTLYAFPPPFGIQRLGGNPREPLVIGADGSLYGTTSDVDADGDDYDLGSIFRVTTDGEFATIFSAYSNPLFPVNSSYPEPLVSARDGWIYSIGYGGRFGSGVVFRVNAAGQANEVLSLTNVSASGGTPRVVVQSHDMGFLVATDDGGWSSDGSILRVEADGRAGPIASFDGTNGREPSSLVHDVDGIYYGTADSGGAHGAGAIFRFSPKGLEHLHSFSPNLDGRTPRGLIRTKAGRFIGFTYGNTYGPTDASLARGTLFELNRDGGVTTLHRFSASTHRDPVQLVEGRDENLFGFNSRSVFMMTQDGDVTLLHEFTQSQSLPTALILHDDGHLYGTAVSGDPSGSGFVFRLSVLGEFQILSWFPRNESTVPSVIPRGLSPRKLITMGGRLYGVTSGGGTYGEGTFFTLRASGSVVTLGSFGNSIFSSSMVDGVDGQLYGLSGRAELLRLHPTISLDVVRSDSGVTLSWPYEAEGYAVEYTDSLTPPEWRMTNSPNPFLRNRVQLDKPTTGNGFFRLGRTD